MEAPSAYDPFAPCPELRNLSALAEEVSEMEGVCIQAAYELTSIPTLRQGRLLTYLAQVICNSVNNVIPSGTIERSCVVATALVPEDSERVFIVGVNGNEDLRSFLPAIRRAIPSQIAGIGVDVILNDESGFEKLFETRQRKGIPLSDLVNGWTFHAEQKVVRHIRQWYPGALRMVSAIGIAHVLGPCTEETAGLGTNHCLEYFWQKHQKAISARENAELNIALYWYAKNRVPHDSYLSIEYMNSQIAMRDKSV